MPRIKYLDIESEKLVSVILDIDADSPEELLEKIQAELGSAIILSFEFQNQTIKPSLQILYQLTDQDDDDQIDEEEYALESIDDQINQIAIHRQEVPNNEFIFQFNPDFSLLNITPPQQTIVNGLLEKGYSASEIFEYIMQLQKNHNTRQITNKLKELYA